MLDFDIEIFHNFSPRKVRQRLPSHPLPPLQRPYDVSRWTKLNPYVTLTHF